jgi:hypothetical protein
MLAAVEVRGRRGAVEVLLVGKSKGCVSLGEVRSVSVGLQARIIT